MKVGQGFWGHLKRLFCLALVLGAPIHAATLRWAPNPAHENVAFYTVYIETPLGTIAHGPLNEPSFPLVGLLPSITYTLSVSATSVEGLESERSAPVPYILGFPVPTIISHPSSLTLPSGTSLTLSVAATGAIGLKYEWYKNNVLLKDQVLPILTVLNPTPEHSGTYTAVVSTPGGHVESNPAQIIVQDPPRIITQPSSASLGVGTPFAFSVVASGTDLRYQWFKAGQPIPGQTNSTLEFPQLSLSDKSSYRVSVWNLVDRIASDATTLDVFYVPVSFTGGPYSTNLVEGGTIRLNVEVAGSAPFTYQWSRNGIPLLWATNSTLVISSALTNDSGSYRVSVSNPINFVMSSAANVRVSPPPPLSDCILTMSSTVNGFVRISALASPNTTYEIQRTASLTNPNWVRMQDVVANASGHFELTLSTAFLPTGFIRTIRK